MLYKKLYGGDRWGLVDISVLLRQNEVVFVRKNSAVVEKLIYNNNCIGRPQLSNDGDIQSSLHNISLSNGGTTAFSIIISSTASWYTWACPTPE